MGTAYLKVHTVILLVIFLERGVESNSNNNNSVLFQHDEKSDENMMLYFVPLRFCE